MTVYSVENLLKDLAPFIHADEDLVAVARGLFSFFVFGHPHLTLHRTVTSLKSLRQIDG